MCVGCIAAKYQFDDLINAGEGQMRGHGVKIDAPTQEVDESYQADMVSRMKSAAIGYAGRVADLTNTAVSYVTGKVQESTGYDNSEMVYQP